MALKNKKELAAAYLKSGITQSATICEVLDASGLPAAPFPYWIINEEYIHSPFLDPEIEDGVISVKVGKVLTFGQRGSDITTASPHRTKGKRYLLISSPSIAALKTLQETVDTHTSQIENLGGVELEGIEETVAAQGEDIGTLQSTVGGHTTDIGSLQTTVGEHTTDIGTLEDEVANVSTPPIPQFRNVWQKLHAMEIAREKEAAGDPEDPPVPSQLRVAVWGDSIGNRLPNYINNLVQKAYGKLEGATPQNCAENGAEWKTDDPSSGGYYYIPEGGTVIDGGGEYADEIVIFYIQEPDAGTFKLQTKTVSGQGQGTWEDIEDYTNVDADGDIELKTITIPYEETGQHQVRIVGLTGIVRSLRGYIRSTKNSGVELSISAGSGADLTQWDAIDPDFFQTYFSEMNFDLMYMEWKDPIEGWADALESTYQKFLTACPNMDWCLIGTSPVWSEDNNAVTKESNAILKAHADTHDLFYHDSFPSCKSYEELVRLGWNGDGTHLAAAADTWRASILMQKMGVWNNVFEILSKNIRSDQAIFKNFIALLGSDMADPVVYLKAVGSAVSLMVKRWFDVTDMDGNKIFGIDTNNGNSMFVPDQLFFDRSSSYPRIGKASGTGLCVAGSGASWGEIYASYIMLANTGGIFTANWDKLIGASKAGWGLPTGTLNRDVLTDESTQTEFNQALMALINDLHALGGAHGLIKAPTS